MLSDVGSRRPAAPPRPAALCPAPLHAPPSRAPVDHFSPLSVSVSRLFVPVLFRLCLVTISDFVFIFELFFICVFVSFGVCCGLISQVVIFITKEPNLT